MGFYKKLKKKKTLKKFLLTYTAIFFVPLLLVGITLNSVVVKKSRENELKQYETQLDNLAERLNISFMDFQKLSRTFSQNSDFSVYSIENDAIAGMKAVTNIRQLVVSNSLIDEIYYKSYVSDRIITKDGVYEADDMVRNINKYPKDVAEDILKNMSSAKKSVIFASENVCIDSSPADMITYIIPVGTETPIASITLLINQKALNELIVGMLGDSCDAVFVSDESGNVVTSAASGDDTSGGKYITKSKSIGMFGYTVTAACKKSVVYKNSNTTKLLIYAVMLIIAILGMIFIALFAYRSYIPIAELNRKINTLVDNDNTTDDEYENLNLGIELLNDNIKKYQTINEDLKKQVKHIMLKNLVFSSDAKLADSYPVIRERACYGAFAVFYDGMSVRNARKRIDALNVDPVNMDIYCVEIRSDEIIGVLAVDDFEESMSLIDDGVKRLETENFRVTVGNFYRDIEGVSKSYSEIVSHISGKNNEYPYEETTKMVEHIKKFEFEDACKIVKNIFDKKYDNMPNMFLKCIAANVLSSFISGIATENILNAGLIAIYKESMGIISESVDADEVAGVVYDCCVRLKENIMENIEKNKGIARKLLEFINDECFDSGLSIKSISNEFGISPSAVSAVFKKETGLNLSKYLWDIRLVEAKKLLAETDIPVNDISEKIGYDIPNSFIRKFRSAEGITPNEWRKRHKQQ